MASLSKSLITSLPTPKPKQPSFSLPQIPLIPTTKPIQFPFLSSKSIAFTTASLIVTIPLPSLMVEIKKAALFDFDLILPIIAVEFVFLIIVLDKVYYSPLGNFTDKRDVEIKEKLNSMKHTSAEVKQPEEQAAAIVKAAREKIVVALNKMRVETMVEAEAKLEERRKKVVAELQEALANLEKQKEETIMALDSQINALSQEIVDKVLPAQ